MLAVLQAKWRKLKNLGGFEVPIHIYQQIIWRRTQVMVKSPTCWESEYCVWCGCEILGKTMEDRGCENPDTQCYPPMLSAEDWEKYKKFHNIKLFE